MATIDNEWQTVVEPVTRSGKTSDNEWQGVVVSANFPVFRIKEEPTSKEFEEKPLNLEEDFEEGLSN